MATVEDNDPHWDGSLMKPATSRADLIYNEWKARLYAGQVALNGVDVNDPPVSPVEYESYLIGPSPTGAWAGLPGRIAFWTGGWKFMVVKDGMRVQVQAAAPGQEGRYMDRFANGWSSLGGVQNVTPVDVGGGIWEASWDLKFGDTAVILLEQPTTRIARPIGVRHGRRFYIIMKQDGAGSRLFTYKDTEWLVEDGATVQPHSNANAVTVFTYLWPGPSFSGAMLISVTPNLLLPV